MNELSQLLQHLKQPEYVHVLLNPLPPYGMMMGAALLLGGLIFKSRGVQTAALFLVAGIGLATWPVMEWGEEAYDRVLAMSNEEAQIWLKVHMDRAEKAQYLFYGTALLALASAMALLKEKPAASILALSTMILAAACAAAGGWVARAGGQVRHSEFREGLPPPDIPSKKHEH